MTAIYAVTEKLEGIVTFGDGMTLQNGRGEVILDKAGKSELEYYMPAELPLPDDWAKDAPPESLERRNKSMELLRERHIYVTPWLPLLWEKAEEPGRSAAEVCGRAAALLIVSLYSECRMGEHMSYEEAREFVAPILAGYGAEEYFSPKEKEYLDNPASTEQEQIQFAWQYENLWVMEWALGFTDDLFWPDRICDVPGSARLMQEHPTMEALLAAAKLRSRKELLEQADLIYRLHWACVDAQVTGMPAPQNVTPCSGWPAVMRCAPGMRWICLPDRLGGSFSRWRRSGGRTCLDFRKEVVPKEVLRYKEARDYEVSDRRTLLQGCRRFVPESANLFLYNI